MTHIPAPQGIASSKPEPPGSNLTAGVESPCTPILHQKITEYFQRPYTSVEFHGTTAENSKLWTAYVKEHNAVPDVIFANEGKFFLHIVGLPIAVEICNLNSTFRQWSEWAEVSTAYPYGIYSYTSLFLGSLQVSRSSISFLFVKEDLTSFLLTWNNGVSFVNGVSLARD